MIDKLQTVTADANVRGGVPVLVNTRVPIARLIAEIAEGDNIDTICAGYRISRNDVRRLFRDLANYFDRPFV